MYSNLQIAFTFLKGSHKKRVKEIFWHPCDDSAAIMFNEGHDLIFVEKKKKTSPLAQKNIFEKGKSGSGSWQKQTLLF